MAVSIKFHFMLLLASGLMVSTRGEGAETPATTNGAVDAALAAAPPPGMALAVTNPPAGLTGTNFESFRLIAERNIFNQNRNSRSARRNGGPTRVAPVVTSLSLVGTMSYAKGDFAFFDGTRAGYKKTVKLGDKIADYEVKQITMSSVKVANESQEFELKIGQQLRREDEGEWRLATGPREREPASAALPATESGSDRAPDATGSVSEDEVLKRLMEKRAKENP